MPIQHNFVSGKADSTDTSLVNPSNWNENHTFPTTIFTAIDQQTTFVTTYTSITFVFRGGLKQIFGASYDYLVSGAGTVVFNYPLSAGDVIEIG